MLGIFFLNTPIEENDIGKMKPTQAHSHAKRHRPHIERMTWLMCKSQAQIYMDAQSVPTASGRVRQSFSSFFFLPRAIKEKIKMGDP